VRTFVAVNLNVGVVRRIADEMRALKAQLHGAAGVKFVSPESLHVTLRFLGSIPEATVEVVRDALGRVAAGISPFELRARGLGVFPPQGATRVIWVGLVETGGSLERLAAETSRTLDELGFRSEDRPFKPHVTVGRVKEPSAELTEGLHQLMAGRAELDLGGSLVREVVVYRSDLKARGAEYTALARVPLGAGRPDFTDTASHRPRPELEDD
jgi:2'-5' RNA ligase